MFQRVKQGIDRLYSTNTSICSERAVIITDSYNNNMDKPIEIIRACALSDVLNKMSIYIYDGELIVGNQASKVKAAPVFPEFSVDWILEELDSFQERDANKFYVTEDTKEILREILPQWKGKTLKEKVIAMLPSKALKCHQELIYILTGLSCGVGHITIDYQKVLKKGINGIKVDAQNMLNNLNYDDPLIIDKKNFYDAIIIICDAAISFALRFSQLAKDMALIEKEPKRKKELEKISDICKKVPANPAENFYEAIQSFWFIQLIIQIESNGHSISPGRFDQYMYEYYKNDLEKGTLTEGDVEELLQSLWIKFNEVTKIRDKVGSKAFGGNPMFQNLILGGVDKFGKDCSNELSNLCIKASEVIKMPQPSLSVRYHDGIKDKFLEKSCELAKRGQGMPAFFNDEVIVPILLDLGATLEEARDYVEVGCVESQVPGKTEGFYTGGFINACKVLEITFNKGVNPLTGTKIGLESKLDVGTFEEFYVQFKEQLVHFMKLQGLADNIIDRLQGQMVPTPFVSCFVDDCIEKGLDVRKGGAKYNFISPNIVGLANIADSLAVIKKIIFEDKEMTINEMKCVLDKNYEGNELLRQHFLNDVPKYGNEESYADDIVRTVAADFCDEMKKIKNERGGIFNPGLQSISAHALFAGTIGATPDGRKAEFLVSDGGVSAAQGRDQSGPTALLNSVAQIDHFRASNGSLLNVKFHPSSVAGVNGTKNMASLIKTFFENKGQHIQFNIVSTDTLRDAQKHPEKYKDLIVRVAGFSVYFTDIDIVLQNDIIERMEQKI